MGCTCPRTETHWGQNPKELHISKPHQVTQSSLGWGELQDGKFVDSNLCSECNLLNCWQQGKAGKILTGSSILLSSGVREKSNIEINSLLLLMREREQDVWLRGWRCLREGKFEEILQSRLSESCGNKDSTFGKPYILTGLYKGLQSEIVSGPFIFTMDSTHLYFLIFSRKFMVVNIEYSFILKASLNSIITENIGREKE